MHTVVSGFTNNAKRPKWPKRLYSFKLGEDALRRLGGAAEAFTAAQLERGFKTLDFYKSLQLEEMPSN